MWKSGIRAVYEQKRQFEFVYQPIFAVMSKYIDNYILILIMKKLCASIHIDSVSMTILMVHLRNQRNITNIYKT